MRDDPYIRGTLYGENWSESGWTGGKSITVRFVIMVITEHAVPPTLFEIGNPRMPSDDDFDLSEVDVNFSFHVSWRLG